jgi:hypothetical protein
MNDYHEPVLGYNGSMHGESLGWDFHSPLDPILLVKGGVPLENLVISILMLLVAAGSFLISLLEFVRRLIDDKINKK